MATKMRAAVENGDNRKPYANILTWKKAGAEFTPNSMDVHIDKLDLNGQSNFLFRYSK